MDFFCGGYFFFKKIWWSGKLPVNLQINSLKNKSTMQKQVIVNRINLIPEGSVLTVTNDGKEILKRNACGFFHEEIFSSVVNEDDILNEFSDCISDRLDSDIDKESFEEFLDDYADYAFSNELKAVIQDDADDTRYDFIFYNL